MNKLIMKPDCMPAILLASIFMAMGMASPAHGQAVEPALEASRQAAEGTRESQENIDDSYFQSVGKSKEIKTESNFCLVFGSGFRP